MCTRLADASISQMHYLCACVQESSPVQPWTNKVPKMAQPDLNFLPPEMQLGRTCSPLSDMFSLGMVVCAIYNAGHSLIAADHNPNLYVKQLDQVHHLYCPPLQTVYRYNCPFNKAT